MKRYLTIMATAALSLMAVHAAQAADGTVSTTPIATTTTVTTTPTPVVAPGTTTTSITTTTPAAGDALAPPAMAPVTTTAATDSTTTVTTTKATIQKFTLKDGSTLIIDGDLAYTIDASGGKVAAADGTEILPDGKSITVASGKIIGGLPELGTPYTWPVSATTTTTTTKTMKTDTTSTPE